MKNIKININYDDNSHNETVFIEFKILQIPPKFRLKLSIKIILYLILTINLLTVCFYRLTVNKIFRVGYNTLEIFIYKDSEKRKKKSRLPQWAFITLSFPKI